MKDDPTIAAVRQTRHKISESVDRDPRKLVEDYRRRQPGTLGSIKRNIMLTAGAVAVTVMVMS